ncbi:ligase [Bradyrhizobium sp. CCBAU 53340]|uniref:O-antigen ligase family protein n=1 Tax=Bradyrhizobium sp. CCBAU 53340 TaxID=1325112 RepID=UPI00188D47F0|nr:O-antigen ligase family protein [Bradyrhizobium sp. CCBAU 53340]QOZ48645.1 ligase [Bradyrhizobium sp. CCBAU 53340]
MIQTTSIRQKALRYSSDKWLVKSQDSLFYTDLFAVLTVALLPWSTSGFYISLGFWFLVQVPRLPSLDVGAFLHLISRPICLLPIILFLVAVLGTLWADVPWQARILGVKPVAKLLVIPFLVHHFHLSRRGHWVFIAFFVSCVLLMILSWIVLFAPGLKLTATASEGVPVKNYIDQSQEFALCMVGIWPCVSILYRQRRYATATAVAVLALGFFANMAFVASARSALVYLPALLIVLTIKHCNGRQSAILLLVIVLAATMVWSTSSYLRTRVHDILIEYQSYEQNIPVNKARERNIPFSTGLRLEYWQKSIRFFANAPLLGNGTGSIEQLFQRDAVGKSGLGVEITKNPHNQTLYVAVQWGVIGVAVLYAMWLYHLVSFRGHGTASWVGLLVVVQNIASSLTNSHLFDFHEGWMYVLGVGTAGGMSLAAKRRVEELSACAADCKAASRPSSKASDRHQGGALN